MSKAVAYIRTSKDENHIDGLGSYKFQAEQISQYAERNGIDIIKSWHENGVEHEEAILDRLNFSAMLFYMKKEGIDTIVVESAGRVSRSFKLMLFLKRQYLDENKIIIICTDMPFIMDYNKDDPTAEFISNTLLAVVQYQEDTGTNIRHWVKK